MRDHCLAAAVIVLAALAVEPALADREPVLKQLELPHSYYWRELYLPQLTTGPSSVTFLPDGENVVYSMGGSLWRQALDGNDATELTHPRGAYDYQPDAAPDGSGIVFARYDGRSIELWHLDLKSGRESALTGNGAVNVEPRLSPDGRRIAWVSSAGTGHLNLFVAELPSHGLLEGHPLLGERQSATDRYYYSTFDHVVNPAWSADGRELYVVTNPEITWGTGDIYAVPLAEPHRVRKVLSEETNWSAHPEPAPSGPRLLYSSYRGRPWHQLWLTTVSGAPPLPLTFGEFDARGARWSPDGSRIAYISNERGNTDLVVLETVGGARRIVAATRRHYLVPRGTLEIDTVLANGVRTPARISVLGSDGRAYAPDDAWMHADDGFDRSRQATESHYFHCKPPCRLELPVGTATVVVQHGFSVLPWRGQVRIAAGEAARVRAELAAQPLPSRYGRYVSADLHVHMNYGGTYRNSPGRLVEQARAEDLGVVQDLIVNKEERVPDVELFRADADPASTADVTILHAQEYHTSLWGHLGLLHLQDHLLLPGFASYRHTALGSPYPLNAVIADLAHAQGGLVGYVHPYDWKIVPANEKSLTHALPADVMTGKVDYLEVIGFSDHKATAEVWYRLLNLGFHLPAGAGTDAMANYASLRGPVGLNRVFLDTGGSHDPGALRAALREGRNFVSNGPLLGLEIGGVRPGGTLAVDGNTDTTYHVAMRSPLPVDHLELVYNGRVVKSFTLRGDRHTLDNGGVVHLPRSGWLLLRAWNEGADPLLFDLYPYATTSPVYVSSPRPPPPAGSDAAYFVSWLDRLLDEVGSRDDFNSEQEKRVTLEYFRHARDEYRRRVATPSDSH